MNVNPALLLVSGLLPFLAQGVSTCQQAKPAAVAGTPSPTPTPVPVLGLFDRPADEKAIGALLKLPAIPGLTELLTNLRPDRLEKDSCQVKKSETPLSRRS
jgi:hypothetical protein